jgi:hypothetical protein
MLASVWILASARWDEIDPTDPRKTLAQEVIRSIKNKWPLRKSSELDHQQDL